MEKELKFAERLKKLREVKNLTIHQVAHILRIPAGTYLRLECGLGRCNLDFLMRVARFYDVTADYLLGLED